MLVAPVARYVLGLSWTEGLLVGAVIASTDAAAVFFLIHSRGLRLRSRVTATLEVESGANDPFAIFLTIALVEILLLGSKPWSELVIDLLREGLLGALIGFVGGRLWRWCSTGLGWRRACRPRSWVSALVIFGFANSIHASGYLAVYLAGLVVGSQKIRAHNSVVAFLDAATWLAQIVMFVLLGLLAWPARLPHSIFGALAIALMLMLIARPAAVFLCLAPFKFDWREKLFIAWVGLRGAVSIFLASIPLLVGLPTAFLFFDVAFVVVLVSLLVQGWTITFAARKLCASRCAAPTSRRNGSNWICPDSSTQELVGYTVAANSPYLRRGSIPSWAKPTLVVREEHILTPQEAKDVRVGDYVYLLTPPDKAQALDRFFFNMPPPTRAGPAAARRFLRAGHRDARRARRYLRLADLAGPHGHHAGRPVRRRAQARGQAGRHHPCRPDCAVGAQGQSGPGDDGRLAARRTG